MRAQVAAVRITDAEFLDEGGIAHAALSKVLNAFVVAVQFQLIKGSRVPKELSSRRQFFLQVDNALAKREVMIKLDKANQVATLAA